MPPKKKTSGKIIDGVDTTSMTREQLEEFAQRIKEENDREREERNFFQMERDKIKTFWDITKAELEEAQAQLRNKDRLIEEGEEKNEEEITVYKQRLKLVQYDHELNLTESRAETLVLLKEAQDDYAKQERDLLQDKRDLTKLIEEQELSYEAKMKAVKLEHAEELTKARVDFESRIKEIDETYEKETEDMRSYLTLKYEMEISMLEERKNQHISEMTKNHETAFNEMRSYYNDIVLNNLALISCLKDQMEVLRKNNEKMNKQVADLIVENKRLDVPLNKALEEVKDYKKQLQSYERDKLALNNNKLQLAQKNKELEELQWSYDALELRFESSEKERDELHNRFVKAVMEVQQKSGEYFSINRYNLRDD